jgi:hypothetical protein
MRWGLVLAADRRGGSLVVVEVKGMDGVARRIQLWVDSVCV